MHMNTMSDPVKKTKLTKENTDTENAGLSVSMVGVGRDEHF